jgi:hypothetical protein
MASQRLHSLQCQITLTLLQPHNNLLCNNPCVHYRLKRMQNSLCKLFLRTIASQWLHNPLCKPACYILTIAA